MNTILYNKLIEIAKKGSFISYQKLSNQCKLGLDMGDINQRNELAAMLGDISQFEFNQNRPLLSVVVFRDDTNMPGQGFFELAASLDLYNGSRSESQKEKFFIEELKRCYYYWKTY